MSPQNSCVEALIPCVTLFGDKAFREVIQVKCGHRVAVILCPWCPCEEESLELCLPDAGAEKAALSSPEARPADPLAWDLRPPAPGEVRVRVSVKAARAG